MRAVIFFGVFFFVSVGHAQLIVRLDSSQKSRCRGLAEIVLSRGDNFLFHTSVPLGGNAEFKLLPGKYQVRAATAKCTGLSEFEFKGQQLEVRTELKAGSSRKPANFGYIGVPAQQPMFWPSPTMWGVPPWYAYFNPWYSNFNSPCVWNPGFCMGPYYPSGGPIAMGKPNLYFEVRKTTKKENGFDDSLHVQLLDASLKGLMASAPAHLEKGWDIQLSSAGVEHAGVTYPYLFYDLRTSQDHLQFSSGFCGEKDVVLKRMDAALEARKYPKSSIKDFRDYWSVHFPAGNRYCVLPQLEKEMNAAAPIQFSKSVHLVRSLFLVVPEFVKKGDPRWPASLINADLSQLKPWNVTKGDGSGDSPLVAYEWGLAFLFANP